MGADSFDSDLFVYQGIVFHRGFKRIGGPGKREKEIKISGFQVVFMMYIFQQQCYIDQRGKTRGKGYIQFIIEFQYKT